MNANDERDARNEAIWQVFMTPVNRELVAKILGLVDNKDAKDRAYQDDMRRG